MKSNALLNDIAKGIWAMGFDGLQFWAPIAHKLMSGEKFDLKLQSGSLINFFDKNLKAIRPDENGDVEILPGSVAVINIVGALIKHGDWCMYGSDDIVAALRSANSNKNIVAIVAYFDGPGGSVGAITPFIEFKKEKRKPIIGLYSQSLSAHMYSMYEICDYVMAEDNLSAMIGSCGVVLSFKDNSKYLETLGFKFHEIYPDESEDKNLGIRLALEGKYELIKKEMLSPLAIKFQDAVKAARPKLNLKVPGILTGKTFYTDEAIEIGMTDALGTMTQAIERALMMSEMPLYK